ncbi:MAG: CrcB family protein [Phycisphaeraceae bacterium]
MSPALLAIVAAAGGLGAAARHLLDACISRRVAGGRPWGTFAVNVTGSLAVGVLAGLAMSDALLPEPVRAAAGIGFLGAYTTFSTWMVETLRLIEGGAWRAAAVNALGCLVAGPGAALAGLALGLSAG